MPPHAEDVKPLFEDIQVCHLDSQLNRAGAVDDRPFPFEKTRGPCDIELLTHSFEYGNARGRTAESRCFVTTMRRLCALAL
jgi:hypothetical protein